MDDGFNGSKGKMDLSRFDDVEGIPLEEEPDENQGFMPPEPDMKGFQVIPVLRGFTEITNLFSELTNTDSFICGGYVRYMCSPNRKPLPYSDIDVYSKTEESFHSIVKELKKQGFRAKFENHMSVGFHPHKGSNWMSVPEINVIKPLIEGKIVALGDMKEIIDNFDFSVIRIGLLNQYEALADLNFMDDERKGRIRIKNIHCPISSTLRVVKYCKKGYTIKPSQVLKLFTDWSSRDDEYRKTITHYLENTVTGQGLTQSQVNHMYQLMRID